MQNDDGIRTYEVRRPEMTGITPFTGVIAPVLVPFLQAVITGALAGIFAGVLAAVLRFNVSAWAVGVVTFTGVTLASWLSFRGRWQFVIEQVLGVDLNHDGAIGEPSPPPVEPLRVEVIQDGGRVGDYIDLPYREKLPELAAGIVSGRQFTVTAWTGAGQLFSRAEFEALRDELVRRGLARWRNPEAPGQGVELTHAGKAVLKRIANRPERTGTE